MTAEESAFKTAIAATPESEINRHVYADWLDEHDRPEEARFHRAFTAAAYAAARDWLTAFVWTINHDRSDDYPHDYDYVIHVGHTILAGDSPHFGTDPGADYFRAGPDNLNEFMHNWSVVTGVMVLEYGQSDWDDMSFSCAC